MYYNENVVILCDFSQMQWANWIVKLSMKLAVIATNNLPLHIGGYGPKGHIDNVKLDILFLIPYLRALPILHIL